MKTTNNELLAQLATAIMLINAQGHQVAFLDESEHAAHWVRTRIYAPSQAGDSEPHGQLLHECLISLDEDEYAPTLHDVQKLINDRLDSELELVKSLLLPSNTTNDLLAQLLAATMQINAQGSLAAFFDFCGHVNSVGIRIYKRAPDDAPEPYREKQHQFSMYLDGYTQQQINNRLTSALKHVQGLLQPAAQQQSEQPA